MSSVSSIHERSSTVLPLPASAYTTVTRAACASKSNSTGRAIAPVPPRLGVKGELGSLPVKDPILGQKVIPNEPPQVNGSAGEYWSFRPACATEKAEYCTLVRFWLHRATV